MNSKLAFVVTALAAAIVLAGCGNNGGQQGKCDGGTCGDGGWVDGGTCGPDKGLTLGSAITAPAETWTWVGFPGTQCMNGSPTGIGVNLNPASDKVAIYFEGGGACFDPVSCASVANPNGFDETAFNNTLSGSSGPGIFDRTNAGNPLKDWSYVFIPYCSGDVYAGDQPNGANGHVFMGYENITEFLKRLVPTFKSSSLVLLTGSSAGGFGSAYNYDQVQKAFGCTPVYLLDDSGPPLSDTYMKPCLQQLWRDTWNLDATLPPDCTKCTEGNGGGIVNLAPFLANKYPDKRFGLLSHDQDATIRFFFSYGYSPKCDSIYTMPAADFQAGLTELRDVVLKGDPNFQLFLSSGTAHTYLMGDPTTVIVNGESLASWIGSEVTDSPDWKNLGP